jgi:murein L,D-transpeptidase YafK
MRNLRYLWLMLLLAAAAVGCASGPVMPEAAAPLDQPLAQYQPQPTHLTPDQKYIDQLLCKTGFNGNGHKPTVLVVHKLRRKLTIYQGVTPLKTYPVVLGNDPYNDKMCQGDTCTPEGV